MRIANRNFAPTLFAVAITIAAVVLFVRLGFWQLDRADQKQALLTQYEAGQQTADRGITPENATTSYPGYQRVIAGEAVTIPRTAGPAGQHAIARRPPRLSCTDSNAKLGRRVGCSSIAVGFR